MRRYQKKSKQSKKITPAAVVADTKHVKHSVSDIKDANVATSRSGTSCKVVLACGAALTTIFLLMALSVAQRSESKLEDSFKLSEPENSFPLSEPANSFPLSEPTNSFSLTVQVAQKDLDALEYIAGALAAEVFHHITAAKFRDILNEDLICTFGTNVLTWIMERSRNLIALIVPPDVMRLKHGGGDAMCRPDPTQPVMRFNGCEHFFGKRRTDVLPMLRNEFFHRVTHIVNVPMFNSPSDLVHLPFLDSSGNINLKLRKQYIQIIDDVIEKLQNLLKLSKKPKERLSKDEIEELKVAENILQNIQPSRTPNSVSKEDYRYNVAPRIKRIGTENILPAGVIARADGSTIGERILVEAKDNGNTVDLYLQHRGKKSKTEILIEDTLALIYSVSYGAAGKTNMWYAEAGSSIETMPPDFKRHVAQKFCDYMGFYIGVEDYCAKSTAPKCNR